MVFKKFEHDRGQSSCFRDKMCRLHEFSQRFLFGSLSRPTEQVLAQDNTDHIVRVLFINRNPTVHIEHLIGLHCLANSQVGVAHESDSDRGHDLADAFIF